jgi:hypothetical protein
LHPRSRTRRRVQPGSHLPHQRHPRPSPITAGVDHPKPEAAEIAAVPNRHTPSPPGTGWGGGVRMGHAGSGFRFGCACFCRVVGVVLLVLGTPLGLARFSREGELS